MRLLCGYHYTLYTLLIIIINIFISIIVVFQRLRKYLFCNAFNKKQRLEAQNMTSWELIFLSVRKKCHYPQHPLFYGLGNRLRWLRRWGYIIFHSILAVTSIWSPRMKTTSYVPLYVSSHHNSDKGTRLAIRWPPSEKGACRLVRWKSRKILLLWVYPLH